MQILALQGEKGAKEVLRLELDAMKERTDASSRRRGEWSSTRSESVGGGTGEAAGNNNRRT
jgi:hypothetical protein